MRIGKPRFTKRFLALGLGIAAPVVLAGALTLPSALAANSSPSVTHSSTATYLITWYGWDDNSPPGAGIASSGCGYRTTANGGTGTYANPITYADPQNLSTYCQIAYLPAFKKYIVHLDQCDPCGGVNSKHFDVWMNSNGSSTRKALLSCENKWTRDTTVILSPPKTEAVNTTAVFTNPNDCVGGTPEGLTGNTGSSSCGASGSGQSFGSGSCGSGSGSGGGSGSSSGSSSGSGSGSSGSGSSSGSSGSSGS